jgi:tRNA threonylcarbamoyl adenosine modification protein YjeE
MGESLTAPGRIVLNLSELAATERLAAALSAVARKADVIALRGDLGVGKTAFARAFIRASGQAQGVVIDDIPSPTFTLVQLYDELTPPVWHVDLYRLADVRETVELGLDEAFEHGVVLIEWPERLGDELPAARLDLALSMGGAEDERIAELTFDRSWRTRLDGLKGFA